LSKKVSSRKSVGALDRETLRLRVGSIANAPHAGKPGAGDQFRSEDSTDLTPPIPPAAKTQPK